MEAVYEPSGRIQQAAGEDEVRALGSCSSVESMEGSRGGMEDSRDSMVCTIRGH